MSTFTSKVVSSDGLHSMHVYKDLKMIVVDPL